MTGIKDWSTTAGDNDSPSPNGAPEGMAPSAVNDVIRQNMAEVREWYEDASWIDLGLSGLTYVDADTFRLTGDQTTQFHVGRRIRATGTTPFTVYGSITASTYDSTNTEIDVTWDSGSLDNTLVTVSLGVEVTNKPIAGSGIKFAAGDIDPTLIQNPSSTKTADYTLVAADKGKTILVSAASADVTITADATLEDGFPVTILRTDASSNTLTFEPSGSQTVNGAANETIVGQYARLGVVSNGSNWFITEKNLGIASAAETLTGTDAVKAISPAGFAGNKDLSASGYYKFPGGLIVQWGTLTLPAEDGSTETVTFPVAFPTAVLSLTTSSEIPTRTDDHSFAHIVGTPALDEFEITNQLVGGGNIDIVARWIAIGN